jgi:hypothetical protein
MHFSFPDERGAITNPPINLARRSCIHAPCFFAIAIALATSRAGAALPPSEAHLTLDNLATYVYSNPNAVSGQIITTPSVVTSGGAGFGSGMNVNTTSVPGRGVDARAYLDDYLIFHVPGGGSAQVTANISGTWSGTYDFTPGVNADFQLSFTLTLGASGFTGKAYANPFFDDGSAASHSFIGTRYGDGTGPGGGAGSYSFSHAFTVFDGQTTEVYSSVYAQCSNGGTGAIDDPLSLTLPGGVTLSSSSGLTYVPEPSTLALLALAAPLLRRKAQARI